MKYAPIKNNLFIENRNRYRQHLKPDAISVFVSNDILPTNADGAMGFRQNSDLFYLTGVDQEDTILVLFPDAKDNKMREILFVKETSELIAIWEGAKLTKEQATQTSGIETIFWYHEFEKVFKTLIFQAEFVYLNSNEHTRRYIDTETAEMRFAKWMKEKFPLHKIERSAPIMHKICAIKSTYEIELIQQACDITEKGFRRLLKFVKPKYGFNTVDHNEILSNTAPLELLNIICSPPAANLKLACTYDAVDGFWSAQIIK